MTEKEFVTILYRLCIDAGYDKTKQILLEEAKGHGIEIGLNEFPICKELKIDKEEN